MGEENIYNDPTLAGGGYMPADLARMRAAALKMAQLSPQDQAQAQADTAQQYGQASDADKYWRMGTGSGIPQLAKLAASMAGGAAKDKAEILKYGPEAQLMSRFKAAMGYAGKNDAAGASVQKGANTDATKTAIADQADATKRMLGMALIDGKIRAVQIAHDSPKNSIVKDSDGTYYVVNKNVPVAPGGAQAVAGADGAPLQAKRALSPAEVSSLTAFDDAKSRLEKLSALFDQDPGSYPGADTVHSVANLIALGDPKFAQLKTLSSTHLFKGLKTNIGGRITNFELHYGKGVFPNEEDRLPIAKAKIAILMDQLEKDKSNAMAQLGGAGRNMGKKAAAPPAEDDEIIDLTK